MKKFNYGEVVELRDQDALRELARIDPEMPAKMIKRSCELPVYDDKETIVSIEYFDEGSNPLMALFSYIQGNDDPKYDGWICRIIGGVRKNSREHIAVLKGIESVCKGRFETADF